MSAIVPLELIVCKDSELFSYGTLLFFLLFLPQFKVIVFFIINVFICVYIFMYSMCMWGPVDVCIISISMYFGNFCLYMYIHIYFQGYWVDLMCMRMYLLPFIDEYLS